MHTRLQSQDDILKSEVRQTIITEIEGTEEKRRRNEAYRRSKIMKDRTDLYVTQKLLARFSSSTVREMDFAISNISIMKKVIDKLSRVYSSFAL